MSTPVAFFEVTSNDHERAQEFYAALFGWQVAADPEMGGYGLVDTGAGEGAIGGGIGPSPWRPATRASRSTSGCPTCRPRSTGPSSSVARRWCRRPTCLPVTDGSPVLADPDGNPVGLWA